MRRLAISLLVILIYWPQLIILVITAAVYDLYDIDRSDFDQWRFQISGLAYLEGGIYPLILIYLSSELRASMNRCLHNH